METTQYDLVEAIVTAHQLGKREGFENALDVRGLIEEDGFTFNPAGFGNDGFADADAIFLEALSTRQQELEGRVQLIEQHYLGVDYRPELSLKISPEVRRRFDDLREAVACTDASCDCGDTHH